MKTTILITLLLFLVDVARAQEINNLVLPAGHPTISLSSKVGAVVLGKEGLPPLVIIPGWGLSPESYRDFADRCSKEFQVHIVQVPGYRRSASYPLPAASYGDQVWTNALVKAVHDYIKRNQLKKPILLGHFNTSTQVVLRLGLDYPADIGGILVAGGPTALNLPNQPAITVAQRIKAQDSVFAPRWFKTVSRETWNQGNYFKWFYSMDSVKAEIFWQAVSDNSIPVMIQYLEEFNAQDTELEIQKLSVKTIILSPDFAQAPKDNPMLGMVKLSFMEPWERVARLNDNVKVVKVSNSHAFVIADQPAIVLGQLRELKGKVGR